MNIVNLPDAKKALSDEDYKSILTIFDKYKSLSKKVPMDYDTYTAMGSYIMDEFERVVPFEIICGDKNMKSYGEERIALLESEAIILGQSRIDKIKQYIDICDKYNVEINTNLLIANAPTFFLVANRYIAEAKDAAGEYYFVLRKAFDEALDTFSEMLDSSDSRLYSTVHYFTAGRDALLDEIDRIRKESNDDERIIRDFCEAFLLKSGLKTHEKNQNTLTNGLVTYLDSLEFKSRPELPEAVKNAYT